MGHDRPGGTSVDDLIDFLRREGLSFIRCVKAAHDLLPPDRRTIIVIVAEVARGGLTQAVLAIEEANGHIDDALAETGTTQPA